MKKQHFTAYWFLLPAVAIVILFYILPIFMGFYNSLLSPFGGQKFVGFQNYAELLTSQRTWHSIIVTFIFSIAYTLASGSIGLFLAIVLSKQIKGQSFYRFTLFLPQVVALVVIGLIWQYLLGDFGLVNYLLKSVGLHAIRWLKTPTTALFSLILVQTWFTIGYNMMLFSAGLQAIPGEFYEAAELDGANGLQRAIYITIPLLTPTINFVVLISTLNAFANSFVLAHVITGGGPAYATDVVSNYIYELAFERFQLPMANAMTVISYVILFAIALGLFKYQERTIFKLE